MGSLPLSKEHRTASLFSAFCLQRTTVLVSCYLFANDCCLCLQLCSQRTVALISCYSLAKDCGPCLPVSICKGLLSLFLRFVDKGLRSLFSAIHLQRTAVLDLCYSFTKKCGPCLLSFRTTVLVIYLFAND